jgi:hypothetical protein
MALSSHYGLMMKKCSSDEMLMEDKKNPARGRALNVW